MEAGLSAGRLCLEHILCCWLIWIERDARQLMRPVQFGLIVPETALDRSRRHLYLEDVNRLLTYVKGHYASAWLIDHLQQDVLEGWTALTYLAALHPEMMWGHTVLWRSFSNAALVDSQAATHNF